MWAGSLGQCRDDSGWVALWIVRCREASAFWGPVGHAWGCRQLRGFLGMIGGEPRFVDSDRCWLIPTVVDKQLLTMYCVAVCRITWYHMCACCPEATWFASQAEASKGDVLCLSPCILVPSFSRKMPAEFILPCVWWLRNATPKATTTCAGGRTCEGVIALPRKCLISFHAKEMQDFVLLEQGLQR
jgi:hypothetical protein|mmetsp:Transcript_60833/g.100645  ORF Transcript_60833/g.100645 Transcript_60833/m.100645 type:complete len:186 (-) Transcript_60833:901-1458(-)